MKRLIRFVLLTFGYLIAVGRVLRQRLVNHRFGVVSFGLFALAGLVGILMPPTQASAATPTAGLQTYIFHNSSNNDSSYYWGDKSNLNTWFEDRGYGSANMTMITTDIGNTWSASQYYTNNTNSPKSYNAGDTSSLDYYSALFLGYIKPDVNIQHLYLQISSDDSSALFFGAGAANGATFSMANAAVNNNYIQGNTARSSGDLGSVTAGKYYPIRAEFGEWAGGDVVNIRYSSDGVNWNALPTTWIYNQGSTVTNDQTAPAAPAAPTLTAALQALMELLRTPPRCFREPPRVTPQFRFIRTAPTRTRGEPWLEPGPRLARVHTLTRSASVQALTSTITSPPPTSSATPRPHPRHSGCGRTK
jgi:hypothetical protein